VRLLSSLPRLVRPAATQVDDDSFTTPPRCYFQGAGRPPPAGSSSGIANHKQHLRRMDAPLFGSKKASCVIRSPHCIMQSPKLLASRSPAASRLQKQHPGETFKNSWLCCLLARYQSVRPNDEAEYSRAEADCGQERAKVS
jgi:hypothetical protein